jgi:membrane-bound lytic murein transglycosylase B
MLRVSKHHRWFAKLLACSVAVLATQVGLTGTVGLAASTEVDAYRTFVKDFWQIARKEGIPKQLYDQAFRGLTPDQEVVELNNRQPEAVMPASQYIAVHVTDARIATGREKLALYRSALETIEREYGVDPYVLLGIWGMETGFGRRMGKRNVIRSLSTLGYKGRREKFGRNQLLAALKILQAGDIEQQAMTGSWAGAMGQTQFIPTSYLAYAVDFTGDGRRDIWKTPLDALASTANYLRKTGWQHGRPWGYEVQLPAGFGANLGGHQEARTIAQWKNLGVTRVRGLEFSRPQERAYLYVPAGLDGPAFLVLNNFDVVMRYNASEKYALAVNYLGDRIRGGPRFSRSWPDGVRQIPQDDIKELQRLLAARGYPVGEVDGLLGARTRAAVRDVQKKSGFRPDGFPRPRLLDILRQPGGANP